MAHVLLCRDERLDRLVAVKRLHSESPEDVERRFVREAKLGAALNHPNIVSVFDTAVDDEGVLIVMEYVEGEPLSRALRRGPLAQRRVARMVRELGAALDHAHANGVVHRDVKPGNVLLRDDGVTKLADLGIATAADLTRITRSGEVLGTAAYMAPEQLEGGDSGPAIDVYALAAVCYEALTGDRPRRGRSALEIAHRIATEDPPDLRQRLPSAPPAAAEALERGMARDPDERPASAGALAAELAGAFEIAAREEEPTAGIRPVLTRTTRGRRRPEHIVAPKPIPRSAARAAEPVAVAPSPARPAASASGRPARASRPARGAGARRRVGIAALSAVAALLAIAAAVAAIVVLSGGDRQPGDRRDEGRAQATRQDGGASETRRQRRADARLRARSTPQQPAPEQPAPEQPAEAQQPAPAEPAPAAEPASGSQLNDRGYALMQQGDYAGAVPVLKQAVASWPDDSTDLTYGYALFNLGKALNRSGHADEAIPYLEKRLRWADQRETVQAELDLARRNAAQG